MRDGAVAVLDDGVLNGVGLVGDDPVLQLERRLGGIDVGGADHDGVSNHVVPGVSVGDMVGVKHIGEDVGEGSAAGLVNLALGQALGVLADGPDLRTGGEILRLRGRDELQQTVVIQVRDGVVPGHVFRFGLLQGAEHVSDQLDLVFGLDVGIGGKSLHAADDCQREQHGQNQNDAQNTSFLHSSYSLFRLVFSCLFRITDYHSILCANAPQFFTGDSGKTRNGLKSMLSGSCSRGGRPTPATKYNTGCYLRLVEPCAT